MNWNGYGYIQPQSQHFVMQNGSFYLPPVNAVQLVFNNPKKGQHSLANAVLTKRTNKLTKAKISTPVTSYVQQTHAPTYLTQPYQYHNPYQNVQQGYAYQQQIQYYNPAPSFQQGYTSQQSVQNYNATPQRQQYINQQPQNTLKPNAFSVLPPIPAASRQSYTRQLTSSTNYQASRQSYTRQLTSSTNYQPSPSRQSYTSKANYQPSPSRQSYNRQLTSSTNYQTPRQPYTRQPISLKPPTSYQPPRQSYSRPLSSSESSTSSKTSPNYESTSDWQKTGRVTRTKRLSGPVTSEAVHSLLSELPWLTSYDRRMINQARCEVSKEWNVFLKNATILIQLEDQDIKIISGSGKNKLVVQKNNDGEMDCDWQDKGIGMKLRNGVRSVGRFFTSIFSSAKKALGSVAKKAIGWW